MRFKEESPLPIVPPVPSGENYEAWRIKPLESSEWSRELAENLIGYAILAASTHNAQPWRFGINLERKTIKLWVDKEWILPASDATGRQAFISVGCALENLKVASQHYGYQPKIDYLPQLKEEYLAAEVNFSKRGEPTDEKLFKAITTRMVNRSKYDPEKTIPEEVLEEMKVCASNLGLELHTIDNKGILQTIALLQEWADLAVMHMGRFRKELGPLLLPNDSEKFRGMPGHNFGFVNKDALRLHQQLVAGGRLDPNLAKGLSTSDREGIISSPLLGIVCIKEAQRVLQVKSGQTWQRMALIAESHSINMSIHAALAEVELSNWGLKKALGTKFRPTIIFRTGYATKPRTHSPRIPVNEVIFYKEE